MVTEAGGVMASVHKNIPFHTHGESVLATSTLDLSNDIQNTLAPLLQ
jgi:hypothetical protein